MPKFGGPGILKSACKERQCVVIAASREKKLKKRKYCKIKSKNDDNCEGDGISE